MTLGIMLQGLISYIDPFYRLRKESTNDCAPPKLTKLSGDVVNSMSPPAAWKWTVQDVIEWLDNVVRLPQYKECIKCNFIDGRRLLLLEACQLPKMGIYYFTHIETIMEAIRKLFHTEMPKFTRSISLPRRYPLTLYYEFRAPTGPTRDSTTPVDFFHKTFILDDYQACCSNNKSNAQIRKFPCGAFGLVKRKSVYIRKEFSKEDDYTDKKFIDFLYEYKIKHLK